MTVDNFLSKSRVSKQVEEYVLDLKLSTLDAVLHFCEKHNIDPLDVNKYLSPKIRAKIQSEAEDLNLLPKQARLPI